MRQLVFVLALVMGASLPAFAKKKRRHKEAHIHGSVQVDIAVEGNTAHVVWHSPGQVVYGFEHEAKTTKQKKQMKSGLDKFKSQFNRMFVFAKSAGCRLGKVATEVEAEEHHSETREKHHDDHDGDHHDKRDKDHHAKDDHGDHDKGDHKNDVQHESHSEVDAKMEVKCKKPLKGKKLTLDISKVFPRAEKVRVTVLSGDKQMAKEFKRGKGLIEL